MEETDLARSLLALLEIKGVGPGAIKKNFAIQMDEGGLVTRVTRASPSSAA